MAKSTWLQKITLEMDDRQYVGGSLLVCFILILCMGGIYSCRLYMLEKRLLPGDREFLSKVRYIITREERKIFLELADSEKEDFRKEFWRRRDPDLTTEENEFKMKYFQRIEEANKLFRGSVPGWLQDRGRIYILIGPPTERDVYPMEASSKPREIWYYGPFPVVFIDDMGTGDFRLQTLSVAHTLELNKAQYDFQEMARPKENYFDFVVRTKKREENEVMVEIEIDLKDIWFTGGKERLETTILLSLELLNAQGDVLISENKEYPVRILEEEVGEKEKFIVEYPLVLKKGKYTLNLEVLNESGSETRRKSLEIEV